MAPGSLRDGLKYGGQGQAGCTAAPGNVDRVLTFPVQHREAGGTQRGEFGILISIPPMSRKAQDQKYAEGRLMLCILQ